MRPADPVSRPRLCPCDGVTEACPRPRCEPWADRYAHPDRDTLVHSPIVPWRPSDPAALPESYLDAVARYLEADDETPAQQRATS